MAKTARIKPVTPSLKEKKRYVAFQVISEGKVDFSSAAKSIWESAKYYLGSSGMAKAGIKMIPEKWNQAGQKGILRTSTKMLDEVKASLASVNKINGSKAIVATIGVSGILNKAYKKYVE